MDKQDIIMILKANEDFLKLDKALQDALDGSGIEDGGKYKNLWNLPKVLLKYSKFSDDETEEFFTIVNDLNLSVNKKYELLGF